MPAAALARCRERGILTVGTATTVREAVALEQDGVDAVVAQGAEAGGHRGTFLGGFEESLIGTMALVPQVADAVSVPVIASGGIMDGRGIAAALALGADLAQMGTAFLTTEESGIQQGVQGGPARLFAQAIAPDAGLFRPPGPRHRERLHARRRRHRGGYPALSPAERPDAAHADRRRQGWQHPRAVALWRQGAPLARRETTSDLVRRLARETAAAQARR